MKKNNQEQCRPIYLITYDNTFVKMIEQVKTMKHFGTFIKPFLATLRPNFLLIFGFNIFKRIQGKPTYYK